jgi:hypothetical protein
MYVKSRDPLSLFPNIYILNSLNPLNIIILHLYFENISDGKNEEDINPKISDIIYCGELFRVNVSSNRSTFSLFSTIFIFFYY